VAIDRLRECLGADEKLSRDNIDIHYLIGCCYERSSRFAEAKDIFAKVVAVDYYYRDILERLHYTEELSILPAGDRSRRAPVHPTLISELQAPTAMLEVRYEIVRKLGEGGMGVVYLARDTRLSRQVAWKVLPAHLAANQDYQKRLLREARAAAQLAHRHIVSVYDVVMDGTDCFITMEYVDGTTLRAALRDQPQLPIEKVLRYGYQTARGLEAAHKAGIVHRDVKPENVLISRAEDDVKIADFGLARLENDENLTQAGCVVGTLNYMPPEQIQGAEVDHLIDVYAFGVLLFEMIAGRTPFVGKNVLAQHLNDTPPSVLDFRADAPHPLVETLTACLE
jgi:serine/threonine protein kinase